MQIRVYDIEWDSDGVEGLPEEIIINVEENDPLLEDIDGTADNLSDYISDEVGFCHYGFKAEMKQN